MTDVPFAAVVPQSTEWASALVTVAVDGYEGSPALDELTGQLQVEVREGRSGEDDTQLLRLPIHANGSEFALIYLVGPRDHPAFESDQDRALHDFAAIAGIVIERTLLMEERLDEVEFFTSFGEQQSGNLPVSTSLFAELVEAARRLAKTECVAVATPAGEYLEVRAATGYHADRLRGNLVPAEMSLMGQVVATLTPHQVADAGTSEQTYTPVARHVDLGPSLVIPLQHGGTPIGSLMLGNQRGGAEVDVDVVLDALAADPRLREVLGLEAQEQEADSVPLARFRDAPEWDWRLDLLARRELMVLGMLGEGLTNAAIAERLFLSEKTVRNYVSNTLTKLGMRRVEAAVLAARLLASGEPA